MQNILKYKYLIFISVCLICIPFFIYNLFFSKKNIKVGEVALAQITNQTTTSTPPVLPALDIEKYNAKVLSLSSVNFHPKSTSTVSIWPPKTPLPLAGAILPFKRIVAYYGNLYSKKMGILGEYPENEMLRRLNVEVKKWEAADPETPVQPALDYIVTTAQGSAGEDGKYRFRMPDSEIDKIIKMAEKSNSIVFLDVQNGLSTVQAEIPYLEKYLKMPQVHLALDPEFSMKSGKKPGSEIGTMSATDINFVSNYLAKLVKDNNLPPKILVIHRFTDDMLTGYKKITPLPEVQIVIDMDGWGFKAKKINTYNRVVQSEPVQFTGFKLFYKNDLKDKSGGLLTPSEVLKLHPEPIYIQYQ